MKKFKHDALPIFIKGQEIKKAQLDQLVDVLTNAINILLEVQSDHAERMTEFDTEQVAQDEEIVIVKGDITALEEAVDELETARVGIVSQLNELSISNTASLAAFLESVDDWQKTINNSLGALSGLSYVTEESLGTVAAMLEKIYESIEIDIRPVVEEMHETIAQRANLILIDKYEDLIDLDFESISPYALYLVEKQNIAFQDEEPEYAHINMLFRYGVDPSGLSSDKTFIPVAGGGGGGGGIGGGGLMEVLRFTFIPESPSSGTVGTGNTNKLKFNFRSTVSEGVTFTYYHGDAIVNMTQGNVNDDYEWDITNLVRDGANTFRVVGESPSGTTSSITFTRTGTTITINSSFNDVRIYNEGENAVFPYTVSGLGTRTAHFELNGNPIGTGPAGAGNVYHGAFIIQTPPVGSNVLKFWVTSIVDGVTISSLPLYYTVIVWDGDNDNVILASRFSLTSATEGDLLIIDYLAFTGNRLETDIRLVVNDVVRGQLKVDATRKYWHLRTLPPQKNTIRIEAGEVVGEEFIVKNTLTFSIVIVPLNIDVVLVDDPFLLINLRSMGRSNSDSNRLEWPTTGIHGETAPFTMEGFNFTSNGWVDETLRFTGNSQAYLDFKPFASEVDSLGRTIEIEFTPYTTIDTEVPLIECMYNDRGFIITPTRATFRGSNVVVDVFFREEERIKLSFVIDKTQNVLLTFINGVLSAIDRLTPQTIFRQTGNPQGIEINYNHAGLDLHGFRVYDRALADLEVLHNHITDVDDPGRKADIYNGTLILDESGNPDIEKIKLQIPVFIIQLDNRDLPHTAQDRPWIQRMEYYHPFNTNLNFTREVARVRTQGTSTLQYPVKNYRLFSIPEGQEVTIDPASIAARVLNLKADYMESSMSTDPGIAKLIESMYDSKTPPQAKFPDMGIRTTIYGDPCVLFHRRNGQYIFQGLYNFNHDKSEPKIYGHDSSFEYDESRRFELGYNRANHPAAFRWPNDRIPAEDEEYHEVDLFSQLPSTGHQETLYLVNKEQIVVNNVATSVPNERIYSWDGSQYILEGITLDQFKREVQDAFEPLYPKDVYDEEVFNPLYDLVKWIAESFPDEMEPEELEAWKVEFFERLDEEFILKYIIIVFTFGLVDNFGKDLMLNNWGPNVYNEGEEDEYAQYKWWLTFYDMDSCIGIDNQGRMLDGEGNLLYDYDIELEDQGAFAQAESKLWRLLIDMFPEKIKETYQNMRNDTLTYQNIMYYLYDEQIAKMSKMLYNMNARTKYIDTAGSEHWLWMLNGRRWEQMQRWMTNRLAFLDSKYVSGVDASDNTIAMRLDGFNATESPVVFDITPAIHQWVSVLWGQSLAMNPDRVAQVRARAGEMVSVSSAGFLSGVMSFTEISILNAKYIENLEGIDLDKIATIQLGGARRLRNLYLTSETPNTTLYELNLAGANLLEDINISNLQALTSSINGQHLTRLRKLNAGGSSISEFVLPEGGVIEELTLPATITALRLVGQAYLLEENLTLEGVANINTLEIRNTPGINALQILENAVSLEQVDVRGMQGLIYGTQRLEDLADSLHDGTNFLVEGLTGEGSTPYIAGSFTVFYDEEPTTEVVERLAQVFPYLDLEYVPAISGLVVNSEGIVTSYTGTATTLEIPETFNAAISTPGQYVQDSNLGWVDVVGINADVFEDNHTLEMIVLPDTMTSLPANLFKNMNSLTNVQLPAHITEIPNHFFSNLPLLEAVDIPSSVTSIGEYAFNNLPALPGLTIAPHITDISDNAFYLTPNLNLFIQQAASEVSWSIPEFYSSQEEIGIFWDISVVSTTTTFSTTGSAVDSTTSPVIFSSPTTIKAGHDFVEWQDNEGNAIIFPYVATEDKTIYAVFNIWEYTVRLFIRNSADNGWDEYDTTTKVYGDTLGEWFDSVPTPTHDSMIFSGQWYLGSLDGVQVDSNFSLNLGILTVDIYALFFSTQGMTITYSPSDQVYDVTAFSPPSTNFNLVIPGEWNDGVNGTHPMRHVDLRGTGTNFVRNRLRGITIMESSITHRHMYLDCGVEVTHVKLLGEHTTFRMDYIRHWTEITCEGWFQINGNYGEVHGGEFPKRFNYDEATDSSYLKLDLGIDLTHSGQYNQFYGAWGVDFGNYLELHLKTGMRANIPWHFPANHVHVESFDSNDGKFGETLINEFVNVLHRNAGVVTINPNIVDPLIEHRGNGVSVIKNTVDSLPDYLFTIDPEATGDITTPSNVRYIAPYYSNRDDITSVTFGENAYFTRMLSTNDWRIWAEYGMFYNCTNITSVDLTNLGSSTNVPNDSWKGVGAQAFYGCTGLTTLEVNENLSFGSEAFAFTGIQSITGNLKTSNLGGGAFVRRVFEGCESLVSVNKIVLAGGVISFFDGCTSLESVVIDIPSGTSDVNRTFDISTFEGCTSLNSITNLGMNFRASNFAFRHCTSLTAASFNTPIEVQSNSTGLFWDSGLTDLYLGIQLGTPHVYWAQDGYQNCLGLTQITIPDYLTSLPRRVLADCSNLTQIIMTRTTPPSMTNVDALRNAHEDLIIYVPSGSVDAYKTATNWSVFADKIFELGA